MLLEEISVMNSLTYFKYFKSSMKRIWQNVVEHRLPVFARSEFFSPYTLYAYNVLIMNFYKNQNRGSLSLPRTT